LKLIKLADAFRREKKENVAGKERKQDIKWKMKLKVQNMSKRRKEMATKPNRKSVSMANRGRKNIIFEKEIAEKYCFRTNIITSVSHFLFSFYKYTNCMMG
jgi:hypothetical protein